MTEVELKVKEIELANLEDELQDYAREILERERAVQVAEEKLSKNSDIDRTDYLFDSINRHQATCRPVVVEVPSQPQTKLDSPLDCLTAVMATLAAITSLVVLMLIVI